jgi:hypothetical protein
MSKHWNPEDEVAQARAKRSWPAGATAGLALVAALCAGVVVTLYWVAAPSDVFVDDGAANSDPR